MIDAHKAIFLPLETEILEQYKGYVLNGELLYDVKNSDLYKEEKEYSFNLDFSKNEQIVAIILLMPLFLPFIFVVAIAALFYKMDLVSTKLTNWLKYFLSVLFRKKIETRINRIKKDRYKEIVHEDLPVFLNHCQKNLVKVYLYSYTNPTHAEKNKIDNLIEKGIIEYFIVILKLSDLKKMKGFNSLSIHNSIMLIKSLDEIEEAFCLGFDPKYGPNLNLYFFNNKLNLRINNDGKYFSVTSISGLYNKIEYYLRAKNRSFFKNDFTFFIEDETDLTLNNYIKRNYKKISEALEIRGINFFYYPFFETTTGIFKDEVVRFIRYRFPVFYNFSESEIQAGFKLALSAIAPKDFYRFILEELGLPFFKRPAFIRSISGGSDETQNKFTYRSIEYKTEVDLDNFFEAYIAQIKIPNDFEKVMYSRGEHPEKYDADWNFSEESKELSKELKSKIENIKDIGEYGVLADALVHILNLIKEDKSELLGKIKSQINSKNLLESKVVLSPVIIDKNYKILLPDYGNVEVKMHALPKTVYILFLKYPNGIKFKELFMHKMELLEIYNKVTNKYEQEDIEKAIDDLIDMTNPSINQKCARIREAFRNVMDEHIAKHYYIDGLNGKPKKISLPSHLIDIRY